MSLFSKEARALLWKEVRQFRRNRGALLSATLLPFLLMVLVPMGQLFALTSAPPDASALRGTEFLPPGMAELEQPVGLFTRFLMPLFITLAGMVVPSVTATYIVVAERERRSLELLMALPVRVVDILAAKVLTTLLVSALIVLPLFALDAAILLVMDLASVGYLGLLLLLLVCALAASAGVALLLALLARDFRTANNLNGAIVGPLVLVSMLILVGIPGDARFLALAAVLLAIAGGTVLVGLRWLTFERYLA